MTTIDKIRADIIRRITDNTFGAKLELMDILSFLDTLEAETSYDTLQYNPSPSVDIGDVARVQFASHAKVFDKKRKAVFDWEQFKEVAGIFYGFGQRNNTLSEEPVSDCHDLDEEYKEYVDNDPVFSKLVNRNAGIIIARHFAEWQKVKMLNDNPVITSVEDFQALIDSHAKRVEADYKEKMIKGAYEEEVQEVYRDDDGIHCCVSVGTDYKPGTIVYVITIPKEEGER